MPTFAATYYVSTSGLDTNPGTESQPWRTIAHANNVMVAGDTTNVEAGTYNEIVETTTSGTSTSPITFQAVGSVITKTFNISSDYITIKGFEMTNANEGYMMLITGSHCDIENNTIHDPTASFGVLHISDETSTGCIIRNNHFYSSQTSNSDLPVIILNGNDHLVENNEIGPMKDIDAFRVWGNNSIIRNNYIHDITETPGSEAHMDVIQNFNCCTDNLVFEQNKIVDFDGQVLMTETNTADPTGNWSIRNNLYINVSLQANVGIPNIKFYNNTFYNAGGGNNLIFYLYDAAGKSNFSGARIKNNLIITASSISSYGQVMSVGTTGTDVQIDNNYIAVVGSYGAVSGDDEPNGINGGNPLFVNSSANDFHVLSGSPAIGAGLTIPGFDDDYDGNTRVAPWTVGAFQFITTTPSNSVGVSGSVGISGSVSF